MTNVTYYYVLYLLTYIKCIIVSARVHSSINNRVCNYAKRYRDTASDNVMNINANVKCTIYNYINVLLRAFMQ